RAPSPGSRPREPRPLWQVHIKVAVVVEVDPGRARGDDFGVIEIALHAVGVSKPQAALFRTIDKPIGCGLSYRPHLGSRGGANPAATCEQNDRGREQGESRAHRRRAYKKKAGPKNRARPASCRPGP